MRADNNWEDKVGKRLYDFEGELSPQAWNNISKKIQPKRRNRWFLWLPLVLVLLCIPAGLYYSGKLETIFNGTKTTASKTVSTPKTGTTLTLNQGNPNSKTVTKTGQKVTEPVENQGLTEPQKGENPIAKTALTSPEKAEPITANSTSPAKTRRTKKPGVVVIPNRKPENFEPEGIKPETLNPEIAGKAKKPAINSAFPVAALSGKKTNQNSTRKSGKTSNKIVASDLNLAVGKNSGVVSIPDITGRELAINSSGKNTASGKIVNPKSEPLISDVAKENTGIKTQDRINSQPKPAIETKQIALNFPAKPENILQRTLVGDSLISKADTVKTNVIAKTDSTEKDKEIKKKQWAFSIYATPHYTFQRVKPNENDDTKIMRLNNKNDFESERFGYEFGLRAFYPVQERMLLEFGFQFAHVTQHLNFTTASQFADSAVVNQVGNTVNIDVHNRELKQLYLIKYTLAGLYTGLNRSFENGLNVSGGIGGNWVLGSKTVPASTRISNASFAPYLSAGIYYNRILSPTLSLQAGPNIQYYLKPLQKKDGLFFTEPTVFGFKIGILFKAKP